MGGIIQLEQGSVWISRCLVLAVAGKNPPQTIGGDKKARTEWCVGCTLLVRVWKAKQDSVWVAHCLVSLWKVERDSVWDAHHLAGIWKVERDGVWVAHRLVRIWKGRTRRRVGCTLPCWPNDAAGGRGHKHPPPHPQFPLSFSFPLFLPPRTPFAIPLTPSVFMT